jgi:hypothetical protein
MVDFTVEETAALGELFAELAGYEAHQDELEAKRQHAGLRTLKYQQGPQSKGRNRKTLRGKAKSILKVSS